MNKYLFRIIFLLCSLFSLPTMQANACSVCYGAPGTQVSDAMDAAVLFMLGVVLCMMGTIGGFMWHLCAKSKCVPMSTARMSHAYNTQQPAKIS